jgi:hypothetical protein
MASNDRAGRPDYGRIRGGAQWAVEPFEETGELQEAGADPAGDIESNELHGAAGLVCGRCGRPLDNNTETRRTADGDYRGRRLRPRVVPGQARTPRMTP